MTYEFEQSAIIPAAPSAIYDAWMSSAGHTAMTGADADSIIEVFLEPIDEGTLLRLVHRNVPTDHRGYEDGGWQSNYFDPMIEWFRERRPSSPR